MKKAEQLRVRLAQALGMVSGIDHAYAILQKITSDAKEVSQILAGKQPSKERQIKKKIETSVATSNAAAFIEGWEFFKGLKTDAARFARRSSPAEGREVFITTVGKRTFSKLTVAFIGAQFVGMPVSMALLLGGWTGVAWAGSYIGQNMLDRRHQDRIRKLAALLECAGVAEKPKAVQKLPTQSIPITDCEYFDRLHQRLKDDKPSSAALEKAQKIWTALPQGDDYLNIATNRATLLIYTNGLMQSIRKARETGIYGTKKDHNLFLPRPYVDFLLSLIKDINDRFDKEVRSNPFPEPTF